jgi:ArsR family transcriptional regulator
MHEHDPGADFLAHAAARFRALGDATRLRIMMVLKKHGATAVGGLVEATGLSQPAVSKHLATLRHAGLVSTRREGTTVFYDLRSRDVAALCDIMCSCLQQDHERLGAAIRSVRAPRRRTRPRKGSP